MSTHHPLSRRWAAWEHRSKADEDESWSDQFLRLCEMDTVETFWAFAMQYPKPSTLFRGIVPGKAPPKIFRKGRESRVLGIMLLQCPIPPETRATNPTGEVYTTGRLIGDVSVGFDELEEKWDEVWERLCLLAIGDGIPSTLVNGVWMCNRTKWGEPFIKLRFEVWLSRREEAAEVQRCLKLYLCEVPFLLR